MLANYFKKRDLILDLLIVTLLCIGLFALFGISSFHFINQLFFTLVSVFLYLAISKVNFSNLSFAVIASYILVLLILIYLYFFGQSIRGSASWISIGPINIQPSEFSKLVLIYILSLLLNKPYTPLIKILISLAVIAPLLLFIFLQPDLGTTLVLLFIYFFTLFIFFFNKKVTVLFIVLFSLFSYFGFQTLQPYQQERIYSFINPEKDPLGSGYNVIQSKIAVGSGGLFGKGINKNTQVVLQFLPEPHTDFIFAASTETYGLLYALLLIFVYLFLFYWIKKKYIKKEGNTFVSSFAIGILSYLLFQFTLNIGMNLGLLPVTGLTLPLISYGGSSLVTTMLMFGILQKLNEEYM